MNVPPGDGGVMEHKARVVKTGLPGNGPRKPVTVDCSCGWMGYLHSQMDPWGEKHAREEWQEHASKNAVASDEETE